MFGGVNEDGYENELAENETNLKGVQLPGTSGAKDEKRKTPGKAVSLLQLALAGKEVADAELLDHLPDLKITRMMAETLKKALNELPQQTSGEIPIEWVVELADEDLQWFVGTAYMYHDAQQTLHVCVPDKEAPTWEGTVPLDFRACHLLECCDAYSQALYCTAICNAVIAVNWQVGWVDNERGKQSARVRWFLPLAYQILVEDPKKASQLITLALGNHITLLACDCTGVGRETFYQLIKEGTVAHDIKEPMLLDMERSRKAVVDVELINLERTLSKNKLQALFELSRLTRKYLDKALEDRKRIKKGHLLMIESLHKFIFEGDLLEGCALLSRIEGANGNRSCRESTEALRDFDSGLVMLEDLTKNVFKMDSTPINFEHLNELQEQYIFDDLSRQLQMADTEFEMLKHKLHNIDMAINSQSADVNAHNKRSFDTGILN